MAASVANLFSLNGRTAVVTGGTRGIGQAMAIALAEAGADIVLIQVCAARKLGYTDLRLMTARGTTPTRVPEMKSSTALVAKHGSMPQNSRTGRQSKALFPL